MAETVRLGDSFSSLAERMLGDSSRWREVEQANHLPDPGLLLLDQQIRPPYAASLTVTASAPEIALQPIGHPAAHFGPVWRNSGDSGTRLALIPAHSYVFVVADEINPLSGKVIRRVITSPRLATEVAKQIGRSVPVFPNPERFGFSATNRNLTLTLGRHAQGLKPSPYQCVTQATTRRPTVRGAAILDRRGQGTRGGRHDPRNARGGLRP